MCPIPVRYGSRCRYRQETTSSPATGLVYDSAKNLRGYALNPKPKPQAPNPKP